MSACAAGETTYAGHVQGSGPDPLCRDTDCTLVIGDHLEDRYAHAHLHLQARCQRFVANLYDWGVRSTDKKDTLNTREQVSLPFALIIENQVKTQIPARLGSQEHSKKDMLNTCEQVSLSLIADSQRPAAPAGYRAATILVLELGGVRSTDKRDLLNTREQVSLLPEFTTPISAT